ncbi:MAG: hypothetical protein QM831_41130 [Kofleriaceae bacterium]
MIALLGTVWLGSFTPAKAVDVSDTRAIVGRAGTVTVFTPADGSPAPTGEVAVVEPLTGMNIVAPVTNGKIALPLFAIDRRPYANAVVLVPATTTVKFVNPSAADVKSIKAALAKDDALSHVKRALDHLEIGAVDLDGDGKADVALTYGCTVWGDGQCQVFGQFALTATKGTWHELE